MRTPSPTRLLASLLSGLIAAGGTPWITAVARADEPSRLLILPFRPIQGQVDAALGPKIEEILSDELHNHDELQLASLSAPTPPAPASPAAAPASAPEGNPAMLDAIDKGEQLVKRFKFKPGADALEGALSDYEALPAGVDAKVLREAYTQLALAQMRSGAMDAGMDSLAAVIRLAPDLPLGPGYPPPFKRAFEQAKHKVTSAPRSTVVIKGEGQIFLDSREQAAAPTTLEDVIPGAHFLRVQRPDGSVWGLKLIVAEGENSATIPESGEVRRPAAKPVVAASGAFAGIAQNMIDDALIAEIAQAGKEANAPFVLFGGMYKAPDGNVGLAVHLYSARAHGEVALDPVAFDADLVSAGIVTNKLVTKIVEQVGNFGTPEEPPSNVVKLPKAGAPKVAIVAPPPADHTSRPPVVRPADSGKHPAVVKAPDDENGGDTKPAVAAVDEPKPNVRVLHNVSSGDGPAGGLSTSKDADHKSDDSSNDVLFYGLVGAGAAAVIAAGIVTFVVVKNNSTPVTGSASLSFQ